MKNSDKSIFEYDITPIKQVIVIACTIFLFILVARIPVWLGIMEEDPMTPWLIACSMTFFYAIANSVLSISTSDQNSYWWQSMLGYVAVAVLGGGFAYLISGVGMDEVGSFKWLFSMFAIGHVLFLAIARTMRKIVKIATDQDKKLRGEE